MVRAQMILDPATVTLRVLVVIPFFSEGSCGLYVVKALAELGHVPIIWDYRAMQDPPDVDYDVALVWASEPIPDKLRKDRKKVLIYVDDPTWWEQHDASKRVDVLAEHYDFLVTVNRCPGFEDAWMPMGADLDVLRPLDVADDRKVDCVFIGTLRDEDRRDFVFAVAGRLKEKGLSFRIYGNGWPSGLASPPAYFQIFNMACNYAKTVLNQHFNIGPSTKVFEIAAAGGGVMITDRKDAVLGCLPDVPVYGSVDEAVALIEFYVRDVEARRAKAAALRAAAAAYSYKNQLGRILDAVAAEICMSPFLPFLPQA